jgi:ATP-dependent DNA helicase 2 subunit 2
VTVEERKKGRGKRGRGEGPAPLSGLDIDAILGGVKRQKLSRDNALPEFKQMMDAAEDNVAEGQAMKQMGDIVQAVIKDSSMGDTGYDIALRYIGEMRRTAVGLEIPEFYNEFAQDLKKKLVNSELGTDRQDFWLKYRRSELGLITSEETSYSKISDEEAKQVRLVLSWLRVT